MVPVTATCFTGFHPLHSACAKGDVDLARELISQGHFVNETNFDLVQPLHEASFSGNKDCVIFLLEAGAQSNSGSQGSVECVKLLLERGANVNPQLLLSSPLHEAVLRDFHYAAAYLHIGSYAPAREPFLKFLYLYPDNWECAQALVDAGANLNHTDCHFGTPLHAAVFKGSVNSVRVLLKAGCNVNSIKTLNTPLHLAARQHDYDIVSLLLEFGADPYMRDNNDNTARDVVSSATSPVKQLLHYWENSARSLKVISRDKIRKCLGPGRLKQIHNLNLPLLLLDYVAYTYS